MIEQLLDEREKTHGEFALQARISQEFKVVLRVAALMSPAKEKVSDSMMEALEMNSGKMARILAGDPTCVDHWKDIAGYAMLIVRELENKGKAPEESAFCEPEPNAKLAAELPRSWPLNEHGGAPLFNPQTGQGE